MRVTSGQGVAAAVIAGFLASTSAWAVVVNVDLTSDGTPVTGVTISFETTTGEPIAFEDLAGDPPLAIVDEAAEEPGPDVAEPAPPVLPRPPVTTVVSNDQGKANVDLPDQLEGQNVVVVIKQDNGKETRREVGLTDAVVNVTIDLPTVAPPDTTVRRPRPAVPIVAEGLPPTTTATPDAPANGCGIVPSEGCFEMSAGPTASVIEQPSTLGTGTVADAPVPDGDKAFGARFGSSIPRYGVDMDFKVGLGPGTSFTGGGNAFIKGNFTHASGDQSATGQAAVGVDGVGGVGYTFVVPNGPETGIIGTAQGFGIDSRAQLRNDWTLVSLSYGQVFDPFGDDGDSSEPSEGEADTKLQYTVGLQFEHIGIRSWGETDLTFNGTPFGGFSQTYDYSSTDWYIGLKLGAAIYHQPAPNWRFHVGANIIPGFHRGRSEFNLVSGTGGGATYDETYTQRGSDFTLGGGLEAGVSYLCDNGWGIDLVGYADVLPRVTSFTMPTNPDQQPDAGYGSNHLWRGGVTLRARLAF
jgi:hypothetical protein